MLIINFIIVFYELHKLSLNALMFQGCLNNNDVNNYMKRHLGFNSLMLGVWSTVLVSSKKSGDWRSMVFGRGPIH